MPALVAAGLAVLIVLYNAGLKRTPLGPLAMGGCRTLNVLLGMSVLRVPWRIEHWAAAAGIGVYIAGVTWFARNDARRSDRRQLFAATLVMLVGVGLVGSLPWLGGELWMLPQWPDLWWRWDTILVLLAGLVLVRCASAIVQPSPGPVRAAVRRSITALIFLDAAACYAAAGPVYAILVAVLGDPHDDRRALGGSRVRKGAAMLNHALELQHRFENSVSGEHRKERGQVFTPPEVARFMADLFGTIPSEYVLLDPGAGIGTLTAAFCERIGKLRSPRIVTAHVFENDAQLIPLLKQNLDNCQRVLSKAGHAFNYVLHAEDFILATSHGSERSATFR